jgi:hypothetical protein
MRGTALYQSMRRRGSSKVSAPLELCESAGETARTCDTKTHAQFGVFQNLLNRIGLESQF